MNRLFLNIIFLCICHSNGISTKEHQNHVNQTDQLPERSKFLENLYKIVRHSYETRASSNDIEHFPSDALNGVYVECILGLSFPCLQKKMINFLYKLDKMKNINLVGKSIAIVRKTDNLSDTMVLARIADYVDQTYLKDIIDNLIDKFFDNHLLRVKIPQYFDGSSEEDEATYVDIDFGIERSAAARDGKHIDNSRKPHHGGGGKMKGMKKLMMLLGLLTCMKLSMLGPMMLGLIGLKAMKALILAVASLTISKMMLLGKSNLHGMLGGHDSGGHGGWDRTIQEQYPSTSSLPYQYMEPPGPYSSYSIH